MLKGLPITELSADQAILHALNRLAYGPRPGDIERVKQMGLARWIDQQLAPNSIDDKALDARLENLPTLRLSTAALIAGYPQPKQAAKSILAEPHPDNSQESMQGLPSAFHGETEDADGPSPMKQPSRNVATEGRGKRREASHA